MSDRRNLIKQLEENIEEYKKDIKYTNYIEEEGIVSIILDLTESEIYEPFSNKTILNTAIFDYIFETYKLVDKKADLNIKIKFPENISSDEKEKIINLFKVNYAVDFKKSNDKIRRTNLFGAILLTVGAILFIIYELLLHYDMNFLFCGIIEIFSWVFIWQSCEQFAFRNSENKIDKLLSLRLFNANFSEYNEK